VEQLKHFSQLTERVLEQTKARVLEGNTHFQERSSGNLCVNS
jgi:hypothetical protein